MAQELLDRARRHMVHLCPITDHRGRRVVLTLSDGSALHITPGPDNTLRATSHPGIPPKDPAEPQVQRTATLLDARGGHMSWRGIMDTMARPGTIADRIFRAHLGHSRANTDPVAMEHAIAETERHAVNIMHRLPLDYQDCISEPSYTVGERRTAHFSDGSRIAWARQGTNPGTHRQRPITVVPLPPDPRLDTDEINGSSNADCANCGGPAVDRVNARRVQAQAYGMEIDEIFCLACTHHGQEFYDT